LATEKDKIKNIKKTTQYQLNIFESSNPKASQVLELLEKVDINTLTPVDALWKLNELKKMME
jgi:DNA mismatch repair protein MutS